MYQSLLEQLPTPDLYPQLIDNYFSQANWNFKTLQPVYFRQLFARWLQTNQEAPSSRRDLQRPSHMIEHFYFPALLFQTLAVSLQFLPPTSAIRDALGLRSQADCDRLSHRFSDHGAQIAALFPHHHARSITAVEHDLMRSLWLKNGGKGIESWYLLGSAIRFVMREIQMVTTGYAEILQESARSWTSSVPRFCPKSRRRRRDHAVQSVV